MWLSQRGRVCTRTSRTGRQTWEAAEENKEDGVSFVRCLPTVWETPSVNGRPVWKGNYFGKEFPAPSGFQALIVLCYRFMPVKAWKPEESVRASGLFASVRPVSSLVARSSPGGKRSGRAFLRGVGRQSGGGGGFRETFILRSGKKIVHLPLEAADVFRRH